jgi:hypothetical protein
MVHGKAFLIVSGENAERPGMARNSRIILTVFMVKVQKMV